MRLITAYHKTSCPEEALSFFNRTQVFLSSLLTQDSVELNFNKSSLRTRINDRLVRRGEGSKECHNQYRTDFLICVFGASKSANLHIGRSVLRVAALRQSGIFTLPDAKTPAGSKAVTTSDALERIPTTFQVPYPVNSL